MDTVDVKLTRDGHTHRGIAVVKGDVISVRPDQAERLEKQGIAVPLKIEVVSEITPEAVASPAPTTERKRYSTRKRTKQPHEEDLSNGN
jgi:hypothetical protein